ncbi:polyamine ABC transporter substrate-binding protein [Yinghuangia seranimata]|uniref:polyamine ABC transporter substrate-binding protein n=1 Tax=Yinghuangia seranimata TaxID=408067 RepID=UPI00248CAB76|nr:spermidine/putrescine ABC transporter substrate-binding protein [Yinghuangia seranimata]MDI2127513.1 spermidine/putrescine ABC transporter substrate-binding protein [Yinghuangia seranimata]
MIRNRAVPTSRIGGRNIGRRTVLRGGGALAAAGALSACGVPSAFVPEDERTGVDKSESDKRVRFSNWALYIDVDEDDAEKHPTLDEFTEATGIDVKYTEEINDNDEFFGKIHPAIQAGKEPGRDLIVISDWMCTRFVGLGWVQKLDKANLPNVQANLAETLRSPGYDPQRDHTVPWASGITGIAYNKKLVGREIKNVADLWAKDLAGRVTLFSGFMEAVTLLMIGEGSDVTKFTEKDVDKVMERVQKLVDKKHIRSFTGNDYTSGLASGDVLACMAYSGDVLQLQLDNPDIEFVVPEEGAELWSENLMVPNRASHKANAEALMNFYYDPQIAAELAASVQYICPVPAAREILAKNEDKDIAELAENELMFPSAETQARLHTMREVGVDESRGWEKTWGGIIGL